MYFTCHAWKEDQFWYKYAIVNEDILFHLKAGYVCATVLMEECLYNILFFLFPFFYCKIGQICRWIVVKNCRREGGHKISRRLKWMAPYAKKMFTWTKTWWSNIIFHLLSINLHHLVCKFIKIWQRICLCTNVPTGFDRGSHLSTMGSPKIHLQYSEVFAIDS